MNGTGLHSNVCGAPLCQSSINPTASQTDHLMCTLMSFQTPSITGALHGVDGDP